MVGWLAIGCLPPPQVRFGYTVQERPGEISWCIVAVSGDDDHPLPPDVSAAALVADPRQALGEHFVDQLDVREQKSLGPDAWMIDAGRLPGGPVQTRWIAVVAIRDGQPMHERAVCFESVYVGKVVLRLDHRDDKGRVRLDFAYGGLRQQQPPGK